MNKADDRILTEGILKMIRDEQKAERYKKRSEERENEVSYLEYKNKLIAII